MAKYVRTKDGKIYDKGKIICYAFAEEYCSPNWNEDIELYLQQKIVAEADTVEELIDEFVIVSPLFKKPQLSFYPSLKEIIEEDLCAHDELYGAIWVDGDLIKVAKLNEKGEFELL